MSGGVAETGRKLPLFELPKVYWSDVRRQRSNSFWAARGGISSPKAPSCSEARSQRWWAASW